MEAGVKVRLPYHAQNCLSINEPAEFTQLRKWKDNPLIPDSCSVTVGRMDHKTGQSTDWFESSVGGDKSPINGKVS